MDGLSGMKIYQTFTIDSKFLPLNYPDKLQFLIKGISHTISKDSWTTEIESLSIPKDITLKDPISTSEPDTSEVEERIATGVKIAKLKFEDQDPTRKPIKDLTFSNNALTLIKNLEGLRLKAYQPIPGDKWTIGYGNTFYKNGKAVQKGDVLPSDKVAAELLKTSVIKLEDILKTNLPSTIKLNQNEYDALISFTYNLGPGWSRSSGLRNLLVNSDYNGAADKLLEYSIAQGKTLKSLLRRRYTERDLFLRT
jgi:lysozyme